MLSAIPSKSNNFQRVDTKGRVMFLHLTDILMWQLAPQMINHVAHIGLGPEHGFVRTTPRMPRPVYLPGTNGGNYLRTICSAVATHLMLDECEEDAFSENLVSTIRDLIRFVQNDRALGVPLIPTPTYVANTDHEFMPTQHLHPDRQTYAELVMLAQEAASTRQRRARDVQGSSSGAVDQGDCPVYCFRGVESFRSSLEEWIEPTVLTPRTEKVLEPDEMRSPIAASSTTSTLANNVSFGGRDLSSKRKRQDQEVVATSFYGAGIGAAEAPL